MYVVDGRSYVDDRVNIHPSPAKRGTTVDVRYKGLLANSGADQVYLHFGFDGWRDISTISMRREPDGSFLCSIPAQGVSKINLCFKDSANNWDNNNGLNWATDIIV